MDPGTSFYVHNDIFRYQDDIFDEVVPDSGNGDYENLSRKMENLNGNGNAQAPVPNYPEPNAVPPQDNGDAQAPFQQTPQAQV